MTKTFQEISEAVEATNIDPMAKAAYGFLAEAFAIDESYDTEADAVQAMTDTLYDDKSNLISIIEAVTDLQTWVVILRLDGADTLVFSRQVLASNAETAADKYITTLLELGYFSRKELTLETVYGPF